MGSSFQTGQLLVKWMTIIFNPLNAELNPISHLLPLADHHILHISKVRVNMA